MFYVHLRSLSYTAQKMMFSIKDFFGKEIAEEILNRKHHFLCSVKGVSWFVFTLS